jgi:hypothetical protein
MKSVVEKTAANARRLQCRYTNGADRPLLGYAGAMAAYAAFTGGLALLGRALGAALPRRWSAGDVLLLGSATFKASRMLSKATVTSPLRAPFTRFEGPAGGSELNESARGSGGEHAIGELVSCPFCLDVWVGTGLAAGLVMAPRPARLAAGVLTAVATADVLHLLYDAGKKLAEG